jgi:hypothetical protein
MSKQVIKDMLMALVADKEQVASALLSQYLIQKTKEVSGLAEEATVKEFKLSLAIADDDFLTLSDSEKYNQLFGEEEDSSWAWTQEVITIESIRVVGEIVYVFPHWEEDRQIKDAATIHQKLQDSLDSWLMQQ